MARMTEQELKKALSAGEPGSLYVLYGSEKFYVRKYTKTLTERVLGKQPSEFNYVRLDSSAAPEEIYDAVEMLPLSGGRKCVCVVDYDVNALSEGDSKDLEQLISQVPDSCVLIFTMPTLVVSEKKKGDEKKNKFKKFLTAAEKHGTVTEFSPMTDITASRQISAWAEKSGCRLNQYNAAKIVAMTGTDLTLLRNEIDKLCAYANGREITAEMIDSLCVRNVESNIFSLSRSIMANDFNAAYQQLYLLQSENERPEVILSVLSGAFIDMYRMRVALSSGKTAADVARDFKYGRRDFVLKSAANSVSRYSDETLKKMLDAILDADIKLKSTSAEAGILLETLIAKLLVIVREDGKL